MLWPWDRVYCCWGAVFYTVVGPCVSRFSRVRQAGAGSKEARACVKALKLAAFQLRLVAGLCESYGPVCRAAASALPQLLLTLLR